MIIYIIWSKYVFIWKVFCYLYFVWFLDISRGNFIFVIVYYCIGRFDLVFEYIKDYDDINGEGFGCVYIFFGFGNVYNDLNYCKYFCGCGLSIMEKMLLVVFYDFVVYWLMLFILIEIVFEVIMMWSV